MLWFRLQQLRSLEWKVRSQAAEKLGESKDPRAVEALVKALKDKDRNVREAAAGSLGRIGDASAVDALLEFVAVLLATNSTNFTKSLPFGCHLV